MTIRTMTLEDLELILGWAVEEGWNPGLDDAAAFFAADPEGFFLKEVAGQAAASISVVNHSDSVAILGLYICKPEFRGQGHGLEVWRHGVTHAADRIIGLDGVPAQQENYLRSGFRAQGATVRYSGALPLMEDGPPLVQIALDELIATDKRYTGYSRSAFARTWFTDMPTRRTFVLSPDSFATARECSQGVKIGPLYAGTQDELVAL
ncbi:MAG: N-acetyltransferase, partial [Rhodobacteraceae bacterium]|nr:N-acetyltransferase [Paracoccaceae bacterium]